MSTLNKRLIQLRNENGALQKDVASFVGISLMSYQRYEYGVRKPTSDIIIKLCEYFNVSADYLLGLSDNPIRND